LERLYVIGFFDDETDRYELIDGDLIEMARMQAPHAATTNRLNSRLSAGLGTRALVIVQNPVILAGDLESVPQPDLTVAKYRKDGYAKGHPRSESVFLVIEVMETSHRYDRGVKLPKYAATGIPETWLVDLPGQRVEVYRNPADGVYLERTFVRPGESISPTAFPEVILPVSEILGLFDGDESEHEGVHES
jgi:Uma2 family endonuclease